MTNNLERLGGRLPLFKPDALTAEQRLLHDDMTANWAPWADKAGFQAKLPDGRWIGPFNPLLLSPVLSQAFLHLQRVEGKGTSLSERVRQVVILTVGAVWGCDYELYAHEAVAREAGLSSAAIEALSAGRASEHLKGDDDVARRFALALTAEHRVNGALFEEARQAFKERGVLDLIILAGCYDLVSSLLNAFEIPKPI
jgi:4-carboxymuconolactone decarboxylase